MNLMRWDPFRELQDMSDRLSRVFARPELRGTVGSESLGLPDWSPAVDIAESPEEYTIKAELPGMKKEDVKLSFCNDTLRIEGERTQEKEEHGKKFHRIERAYGSFVRTFVIPNDVAEGSVNAEFKDGVLQVHLPRSKKSAPKTTEVKIS